MMAQADFLVFGFLVFVIWSVRHWLTEHPAANAMLGFAIVAFGALTIFLLPQRFELHHLIAGGLFFCLGLGLFFSSSGPSGDRTGRLRRSLLPEERRLAVQETANDARFANMAQLQNASMAERHREMKIAKVLDELDRGTERQDRTAERVRRLREKIRRLGP
ncbi:MAG: hypothetical protein ACREPN_10775 [Rudaea sp.]